MERRRPLVRIILDDKLALSSRSQLVRTAHDLPVVVFAGPDADEIRAKELKSKGVDVVRRGGRELLSVLDELGERSLQSILVEGGSSVAGSFIDARLVNKATFFIAPKIIGGRDATSAVGGIGIEHLKDALTLKDIEVKRRGDDIEITGYPDVVKE
jgi:diaminohydroxyphosphoribosylaminopyrimidine deaminase / 5-amino-6-(5-phosphoribosylamino)uracil reductase